jgi:hypothetical protein
MVTGESAITEEMRAALNKESEPWPVEIDRAGVRMYARSARYTNPIYYDVQAARDAGYPDLPAPPGFFGKPVFLPGKSNDTFSSPSSSEDFPTGEFQNILNGGMRTTIHRRIFAGEELTMTSKWTNLTEREGSLGRMLIVDNVTTFRDAAGDVVAESGETSIRYKA